MITARIAATLKEHGWLLNLLFIALGAYFVAGAANAVVARSIRVVPSLNAESPGRRAAGPTRRTKSNDLSSISERNLLGAKRESLVPVADTVETDQATVSGFDYREADLKPCTLSAAVRATLVADSAPEWSMAVVYDNASRETQVYNIIEGSNQIADDATLVDVRSREIVVRRRDRFELCSCDTDANKARPRVAPRARDWQDDGAGDGAGITKVSETQYTVDRSEVDNALSNLSRVATQARIVPSFKNGKPNGFKLFSIKPGSIYSKIGLKNGDVIQKINGYEINSPDKALEIYQKLKDATSVAIELQRRGKTQNFSYAIQ